MVDVRGGEGGDGFEVEPLEAEGVFPLVLNLHLEKDLVPLSGGEGRSGGEGIGGVGLGANGERIRDLRDWMSC